MAKTTDALKILDQMIGDDPDMRQMIAEETLKAQIARMIYEARTAAGLTQQTLAARVGTKPSVIARLEEADMDSDGYFRARLRLSNHDFLPWNPASWLITVVILSGDSWTCVKRRWSSSRRKKCMTW